MAKLVTRDNVNEVQFFQMPKIFFADPRYMGMRSDAKLAYMLMHDLLPLSMKNNWVNGNGEVFVKLSRNKLMEMLNIRGTQKAALIMKELVDCGLILVKKMGLNQCHEIYLYALDEKPRKVKAKLPQTKDRQDPLTPQPTRPVQIVQTVQAVQSQAQVQVPLAPASSSSPPVSPSSGSLETHREEVQYLLKNKIHLEDLKLQYYISSIPSWRIRVWYIVHGFHNFSHFHRTDGYKPYYYTKLLVLLIYQLQLRSVIIPNTIFYFRISHVVLL